MQNGLPSLLDAIFGKKDLTAVSVEELQDVISEFPSFNAAHFFLAKKLKEQHDTLYEKESRRTALYFNNAYWLQSILEENDKIIFSAPLIQEPVTADHHVSESDFIVSKPDHPVNDSDDHSEMDLATEQTAETEPGPGEEITGSVSSFDELLSKYKIEEPEEDVPPPQKDFSVREEVLNEYGIFEEEIVTKHDFDLDAFDPPEEDAQPEEEIKPQESLPLEISVAEKAIAENQSIVEPALAETTFRHSDTDDYDAFDRPAEHHQEETHLTKMQTGTEEADDTEKKESDPSEDTDPLLIPVSGDGLFSEQQKTLLAFDSKKAESIVFAPYHVIDYFASQGIKLVLEDNPPDNFGKQLKSFTDWLKVMKKLPPGSGNAGSSEKQETERIRHFAEHSIEERDVLTESMAEVLAKQGMIENAIALYHKLSLIYPPKSAYFASRIEQLKASSL